MSSFSISSSSSSCSSNRLPLPSELYDSMFSSSFKPKYIKALSINSGGISLKVVN